MPERKLLFSTLPPETPCLACSEFDDTCQAERHSPCLRCSVFNPREERVPADSPKRNLLLRILQRIQI